MSIVKSINGNPIKVDSSGLDDNAVTTAKIADGAVTSAKLASGAVAATNLADGSISTAKLADGAVTTAKLGAGSVTSAKIADGAVTPDKIADGVLPHSDMISTLSEVVETNYYTSPLTYKSGYLTGDVGDVIGTGGTGYYQNTNIDVTEGDVVYVRAAWRSNWNGSSKVYLVDSSNVIVSMAGDIHTGLSDGDTVVDCVKIPSGVVKLYAESYSSDTSNLIVCKISGAVRLISDEALSPTFEVGSIGTNNGRNSNSTTRIRTVGYVPLNGQNVIVSCDDGYKVGTRAYDASNTYLPEAIIALDGESKQVSGRSGAKSVRLIAAYGDDGTITSSDIPSLLAHVRIQRTSNDITLSQAGAPSDSAAVGKRLEKSIKILGIGNSHTRDSLRWLWKILKEAGYSSVTVGHGYWGASQLSDQYASLDEGDENHNIYQYWKYTTSQDATKTSSTPLDTIFEDEPWDVVIFQQQLDYAGQYDSFVSSGFDINDFIAHVKSHIDNDSLKVGIAQTWSHAHGYTGEQFIEFYGGDPDVQLQAVESTIPMVADHMSQCDYVIKSGEAVKIARQNTYLGALGDEMLRTDKNHLQYGIPSFMSGMVYAMTICGVRPSDIGWYPTATDEGQSSVVASAYLAYLAKQCAAQATLS